jgi:hypothetical protein
LELLKLFELMLIVVCRSKLIHFFLCTQVDSNFLFVIRTQSIRTFYYFHFHLEIRLIIQEILLFHETPVPLRIVIYCEGNLEIDTVEGKGL